ncbi:alkaline-phosphatase-like protein [Mariannaea sp. PMI_226]|nr:alkaline-phosphatase-like protein [Mariannaea sp. PMI_226]
MTTMKPKKNILLMIADDLGRDISCYDPESPAKTPHLSSLAQDGTRFTHGFTSTASCSPSRTVIYTGLHTHTNGNYGLACTWSAFGTFPHIDTAPKIFKSLGYATGIVGKVHVGPADVYPWEVREESGSRDVAWVADRAEAFIADAQRSDKPFFLTVGYVDPHRNMAERGGFGNKDSGYDSRIKDKKYDPQEIAVPAFLSDLPEVRTELAEYCRSINRLDQGIGLIMEKLKLRGVADDTLVFFMSDNGPPFVNSKTTLYDAGIHLPLIIRQPGVSGVINPNLVSWVDILPTMLDWAGHAELNNPSFSARRGRSLLPIMSQSERLPAWTRVFGSHTFHEISNFWPTRFVRTDRFKYHRNVAWKLDFPFAADLYASLSWDGMRNSAAQNGGTAMVGPRKLKDFIRRPPEELYDLENDPNEVNNIVNDPNFIEVVQAMRADLEKWQADTSDPFLWRDGISMLLMKPYVRDEGLRVPDRWDFDVDSPENTEGKMLTFETKT